jgi:hypothetical protein
MTAPFINLSTEGIAFKRYQTAFYYETMDFIKDELEDVVPNPFFKKMLDHTAQTDLDFKAGSTDLINLKKLRTEVLNKSKFTEPILLEKHIIQEQIFKNLFKYSIWHLLNTQKNTLFILPCFDQADDNGASRFIKNIATTGIETLYKDIFTNTSYTSIKTIQKKDSSTIKEINTNQIVFIKAFSSETNESMDTYKDRIAENIRTIEQTIQNRGNNTLNEPFTQIIYFVNNDNTMFTHYFKNELKKKYAEELNKQINDFYSKQKIGAQQLSKSSTVKFDLSELSISSINNKITNLDKVTYKGVYTQILLSIKDTTFKQNEQLLLDKLNNFYKIRLDVSAMKTLSSTDNSSLFNIYMRVDNLDRPVVTNEIRPSKDTLYKVYSSIFEPRIGHFSLSNKSKNQYTFTIDKIENALYKYVDTVSKIETKQYIADKAKIKKAINTALKEEMDAVEDEEEILTNSPENAAAEKAPRKNRIFEIRYSYGQIQYKDITKQLVVDWDNDNYIDYYKERSVFENYKWFSHKMIDNKYKENINIKYYKDTVYDIASLKAYLVSEKKYTDKTRLAVEFLDINLNDQELIKYNNFIYEKFKKNINKSTAPIEENTKANILFEDKIKRGICEILFEQNTLILIKSTVVQTEKEKEKATSDNFKMIKYEYTPINANENSDKVKEVQNYFKNKPDEKLFLRCDNKQCTETDNVISLPSELTNQFTNKKKSFALTLIKITKDVLTDPVKLYLAAECKSRKKKIQDGYYKVLKMFSGGSIKKRRKRRMKYSRTKSRRTYSLRYPKA